MMQGHLAIVSSWTGIEVAWCMCNTGVWEGLRRDNGREMEEEEEVREELIKP